MKTYKSVYKFPLVYPSPEWGKQVYDADMNFVFQFEFKDFQLNNEYLKIINGETKPSGVLKFIYDVKEQQVLEENQQIPILTIRGYGNLIGRMKLPEAEAANIQDTFAQFIINQLNGVEDGNIKP